MVGWLHCYEAEHHSGRVWQRKATQLLVARKLRVRGQEGKGEERRRKEEKVKWGEGKREKEEKIGSYSL